jgi:ribokinase
MGRIVVVGSLNMDLVFRVARAPAAGETLTGRSFSTAPGGKGANQAIACARMGARVAMVGCVGADDFGATLRQGLIGDGVDATLVTQVGDAPTGVALVMVEDGGQNRIVVAPGANARVTPGSLEAARGTIAAADMLVLQLETPLDAVTRAAEIARAAGRKVMLNPAPAQPLPDRVWPSIDILAPNESEASALAGVTVVDVDSACEAARRLRARGVGLVVVTLGARGVVIADAVGERHYPAFPAQALDTTAAGDTFLGAFAAGLTEGLDTVAAAELGQRAAAICVAREGAQPSIPFRREL